MVCEVPFEPAVDAFNIASYCVNGLYQTALASGAMIDRPIHVVDWFRNFVDLIQGG